jgi:hypothetical protein
MGEKKGSRGRGAKGPRGAASAKTPKKAKAAKASKVAAPKKKKVATKKTVAIRKKVATGKKVAPKKLGVGAKPPIGGKALGTPEARERALDKLAVWFVDALVAAKGNLGRASEIIRDAIGAFYDIRESADQERGEYAGHFFMVDAVGIDESDRPVPWFELEKQIAPELLHQYQELFTDIESSVR